ncbi:hypothetical protein ScalyP_jg6442 [Parmales sp. scaly parma]|nr:hypothetical protein ScalyP_jg6442 [Parmales sp. scaly parma]
MKMSNNMLKELLSDRKLKTAGSKQLLADRLAVQMEKEVKTESLRKELVSSTSAAEAYSSSPPSSSQFPSSSSFKQSPFHTALSSSNPNLPPLTQRTTSYLNKLSVTSPTKIQSAVLPRFLDPQTKEEFYTPTIIHAETGSGKTLAYLLPIAEKLNSLPTGGTPRGISLILTPTLELASQIAYQAIKICPIGTVHLLSPACDVNLKRQAGASLFIGSELDVFTSFFGNDLLPASPTPKPLSQKILSGVEHLILDEVDGLLLPLKTKSRRSWRKNVELEDFGASGSWWRGEKMAGVIARKVWSGSKGSARVWAASATVGRPLRREFARVLGLDTYNPAIIRIGEEQGAEDEEPGFYPPLFDSEGLEVLDVSEEHDVVGLDTDYSDVVTESSKSLRAVTIPKKVDHFVTTVAVPVKDVNGPDSENDDEQKSEPTNGSYLAVGATVAKNIGAGKKVLIVLTHGLGIDVRNAVGACRHLGAEDAIDLQDLLDFQDESYELLNSGVSDDDELLNELLADHPGNLKDDKDGYVLVTKERSIRGLDLQGLDAVVVIGRPVSPDEYVHIAGRTGRVGKKGSVYNVLSGQDKAKLKSWEKMLSVKFVDYLV